MHKKIKKWRITRAFYIRPYDQPLKPQKGCNDLKQATKHQRSTQLKLNGQFPTKPHFSPLSFTINKKKEQSKLFFAIFSL